jgi:NitT/TauT family transport system permease protein
MAYTFYRVCLAVGVSFVSGVVGAIWSSKSSFIKAFLQPFITLLKTTPVMAVVMLALLWLNSSTMPILVGFLMCFPIVYTNLLVGIENRDETVFEMAKVYRVKRKVFIFKLYIPSLLPSIYSALSLSFGLAWKAVIAAEVLAAPKYGMGYHLLTSKIYLETDRLFSWVILIVVFSTILERLLRKRSRYFDKN